MIQEKQSDITDVIIYEEKPITEAPLPKEEIKIYDERYANWKECLRRYWSFFAVTTAFAAIFLILYIILNPEAARDSSAAEESDDRYQNDIPVGIAPENSDTEVPTGLEEQYITIPPIVLDESMLGIDVENEIDENYSLAPLIGASEGVNVIITHSHTSEYVSESQSVADAGEVLMQILNSGGIKTYHCTASHDAEGTLGAYKRMNETLKALTVEYPGVVLVIDLHDSDSGKPLTFTVGTGFEYGWRENLKAACAVSANISDTERVIRLLPGELGQNSGILTLNIGICGKDYSDEEARKALASLAKAILIICEEITPAEN